MLQLLGLLRAHSSALVQHFNVELLGALDDLDTLARGNVVGNFSGIQAVFHHQRFQFFQIAHCALEESIREKMTRGTVRAITDGGHGSMTLESSTLRIVNTARFAPIFLRNQIRRQASSAAN